MFFDIDSFVFVLLEGVERCYIPYRYICAFTSPRILVVDIFKKKEGNYFAILLLKFGHGCINPVF